jgi:NAD(P)-dependent dehydrogenase (short-subunit alcohol dehydrogenase family)
MDSFIDKVAVITGGASGIGLALAHGAILRGAKVVIADIREEPLAQALAEAGLALYPFSEDILAISSLLAITREDWPLAVEILEDLISVQNDRVQPMTYQMLARALACNLDVAEAHQVLETALQIWPNDATLIQERNAMATAVQDAMPAPKLTN